MKEYIGWFVTICLLFILLGVLYIDFITPIEFYPKECMKFDFDQSKVCRLDGYIGTLTCVFKKGKLYKCTID